MLSFADTKHSLTAKHPVTLSIAKYHRASDLSAYIGIKRMKATTALLLACALLAAAATALPGAEGEGS